MQLFHQIPAEIPLPIPGLPETHSQEMEVFRKNGTSYWSETTFTLVQDKNGKVVGIMGTGRDITERKRAEQALRESEQRFRSFIEQSAEGVMIVDEEGRIIEWNDSERTNHRRSASAGARELLLGHPRSLC